MIQVTKEEAEYLRTHFPSTHVAKTKHKYYAAEDFSAMKALKNNQEAQRIVEERSKKWQKRGGKDRNRQR